jgi:hypothetical protein
VSHPPSTVPSVTPGSSSAWPAVVPAARAGDMNRLRAWTARPGHRWRAGRESTDLEHPEDHREHAESAGSHSGENGLQVLMRREPRGEEGQEHQRPWTTACGARPQDRWVVDLWTCAQRPAGAAAHRVHRAHDCRRFCFISRRAERVPPELSVGIPILAAHILSRPSHRSGYRLPLDLG